MTKYFVFVLVTLFSCKQRQNSESTQNNIDFGARVFPTDDITIPAVIFIDECVATIVSDTTILTAAHCLKENKVCLKGSRTSSEGQGLCSENILFPKEFDKNDMQMLTAAYDIAVVVFPPNSFKNYFEVSNNPPQVGDKIYLVGYSLDNLDSRDENGSKRWGNNRVLGFELPKSLLISKCGKDIDSVALGKFDGGGPAITSDCQVTAVAHSITAKSQVFIDRLDGNNVEKLTNVHATVYKNIRWLKSLDNGKQESPYLCGLSGTDANHCSGKKATKDKSGEDQTPDGRPTFPCISI